MSAKARPAQTLHPTRVVGIGASAGGLDAFSALLGALPTDTGCAFLLIPHLSPTHPSRLTDLMMRVTEMPVVEARDEMPLLPDRVHVLPPDRRMLIHDGTVRLEPRPERDGMPTVIDECFKSLADQWGAAAVGIVLSGTGSDGAAGLKAIKEHGGVTYAQDFGSATYDGMPRAAVEAGGVDHTLPPVAIAHHVAGLARTSPDDRPAPAAEAALATPEPALEMTSDDTDALTTIVARLQEAEGTNFQHYKRATMARRVVRRASELGLPNLTTYLSYLQKTPSETKALFKKVLIHVTDFFREPATFDVLRQTVLPALIAHRPAGVPLRIWVVGCATGEEVYSTAIVFAEGLEELTSNIQVKIFASDLSETAILAARKGRYSRDITTHVSAERLQRYFVPVENGYQIIQQLRDTCIFARQDVTQDPPFAQLDLVICRNLLIYLEPVLQQRVLHTLHYALKPGGFLAVGSAESVAGLGQLFSPLDRKHKVFLRRTVPSHLELSRSWSGGRPVPGRAQATADATRTDAELRRIAEHTLFSQLPTGSVIVNSAMEIRHFQGSTRGLLEAPVGGPTTNLLKLSHPDLQVALGRLVRKARKEKREASRYDLPVHVGKRVIFVSVRVFPLPADDGEDDYVLVTFQVAPPDRKPARRNSAAPSEDQHTVELEQELADTKEYLQSVIDQQDEIHAELQAAYEASLSANEEFQSTNEELESTKEELSTVNEQIQENNTELLTRNAEITSLLEAMDFPILLLGQNQQLQAVNTAAVAAFRLKRPILGQSLNEMKLPVPVGNLSLARGTRPGRRKPADPGRAVPRWWLAFAAGLAHCPCRETEQRPRSHPGHQLAQAGGGPGQGGAPTERRHPRDGPRAIAGARRQHARRHHQRGIPAVIRPKWDAARRTAALGTGRRRVG